MLAQKNLITKFLIFIGIAALVSVALIASRASAQSSELSNTANTLKVSPVRTDLAIDPGDTKTVKVTITNPTDQDVVVRPVQNDFVADDEAGTPALILDEAEFAPSHSLKRFMQPLENINLGPKESKTVELTISVPANAEAGGYFGALRFAPTSPNDGGQVRLSASVASLVLVRVNGDVPEKLNLTDFQVLQRGAAGGFFNDSKDLEVIARFQNNSNVQLGPFGKLSVKKGNGVVYETDFNNKDQRDMILPDSARRWRIPVDELAGFGKYTAFATFTYGSTNKTIEISKSFWIVPVWMIIAATILVLAIITAVVWFILSRRSGGRSSKGRMSI